MVESPVALYLVLKDCVLTVACSVRGWDVPQSDRPVFLRVLRRCVSLVLACPLSVWCWGRACLSSPSPCFRSRLRLPPAHQHGQSLVIGLQMAVMCASAAALSCASMTGYSGAAGNCSCAAGYGGTSVAYSTTTGAASGCTACAAGTYQATNETKTCTGHATRVVLGRAYSVSCRNLPVVITVL